MGAVTMFHPPSGRSQRASADAYERVWRDEGWVLVAEPEPPHAPPAGPSGPELTGNPDQVPDGTMAAVMEWVAGDREKAVRALEAEQTKGDKARSTLIGDLMAIVGPSS